MSIESERALKIERVMNALGVNRLIARDYLESEDWLVFEAVRSYRLDHQIGLPQSAPIRSPGSLWL